MSRTSPAPARAGRTAPPAPWLLGPRWRADGLRQPGWLILPLRVFLGITFVVAGLQKLANPAYLDPHSPVSVQAQMGVFRHTSPIGGLLGLASHQAGFVGVLIALGELAVGLGTLAGLWTRLAAAGGALLSLTFFLTVSWHTRPYYYGSDIVFLFAWTVLVLFGAAGVLCVDGWLEYRARRDLRMAPAPATVGVAVPRLRALCDRGRECLLADDGVCGRVSGCPLRAERPPSAAAAAALDRRKVLRGGQVALALAAVGGLGAGFVAVVGRLVGGTGRGTAAPSLGGGAPTPTPRATASARSGRSPAGSAPGTAIGPATKVPVGQGAMFTDPASQQPAWVVHERNGTFVAFSAICTHAGCTVGFDPNAMQFVCPCHGGTYDARTGQVVAGPPPSPLGSIPVHVVAGEIRVD